MVRESTVEDYLVRRVKECGGETRKVKWIGRNKAPDRVVMGVVNSSCWPIVWVELKRPGGAAKFPSNAHEEGQWREHERMRKLGQLVVVIDSFEGVEELLA